MVMVEVMAVGMVVVVVVVEGGIENNFFPKFKIVIGGGGVLRETLVLSLGLYQAVQII